MHKQLLLLSLAGLCCLGVTCRIDWTDGGNVWPPGYVPLDQAEATIVISQSVGDDTADVVATIVDGNDRPVTLDEDQEVAVNGEPLSGPYTNGRFTATVPTDDQYEIRVREPTRGVERTIIERPADFVITSPAEGGGASLSGFTLRWSEADDRLQVEIKIAQTIMGVTTTRTYGPFADTGSRTFQAVDLVPYYVQGRNLEITVTKFSRVNNVAGFGTGTATARVSVVRVVSPRP